MRSTYKRGTSLNRPSDAFRKGERLLRYSLVEGDNFPLDFNEGLSLLLLLLMIPHLVMVEGK